MVKVAVLPTGDWSLIHDEAPVAVFEMTVEAFDNWLLCDSTEGQDPGVDPPGRMIFAYYGGEPGHQWQSSKGGMRDD